MSSVKSILIRPERKAEPLQVTQITITPQGIEGDYYHKEDGKRQVTLIAAEGLAEMAAIVGFQGDAHLACRRNILIESLPEGDLKGKMIGLGDKVLLEITGYCHPCFRMDENFGEGAIAAFDKRAGWTARVIEGGHVGIGDPFFLK